MKDLIPRREVYYRGVNMYRPELWELFKLLSSEQLEITTDKIRFDTADEFMDHHKTTPVRQLEIIAREAELHITFRPAFCLIRGRTQTFERFGRLERCRELILRSQNLVSATTSGLAGFVLPVALVPGLLFNVFVLDEYHVTVARNRSLEALLMTIVFLGVFYIYAFASSQFSRYAVYPDRDKPADGFYKRNKDVILSGLIVAIIVYFFTPLLNSYLRK